MARNSYFNENTLEELLEEIKYVYQSDKRPWVIGYSGGKDSTTVVELVYKMLQIPDGCAECFPFELIDEFKQEYLTDNS